MKIQHLLQENLKRLGPDENDPWEQGWRAAHRRQDETDCPYERGSKEHAQWMDGYDEGHAQPDHYNEDAGQSDRLSRLKAAKAQGKSIGDAYSGLKDLEGSAGKPSDRAAKLKAARAQGKSIGQAYSSLDESGVAEDSDDDHDPQTRLAIKVIQQNKRRNEPLAYIGAKKHLKKQGWSDIQVKNLEQGVAEGSAASYNISAWQNDMNDDPDVEEFSVEAGQAKAFAQELKAEGFKVVKIHPAGSYYKNSKLLGKNGVAEGEEQGTFAALKGWQQWNVLIMNNFYNGKYPDYSARMYGVVASSPEEARQVVLDNADYVLKDLLTRKTPNGKRWLPRNSALPIEDKRVGQANQAKPGSLTTLGFKTMLTPEGPKSMKFSNGQIVDIHREESAVTEGGKNPSPGWMLRQDPVLAKKVKDAKAGYQDLKKYAGKDIPKKDVSKDSINEHGDPWEDPDYDPRGSGKETRSPEQIAKDRAEYAVLSKKLGLSNKNDKASIISDQTKVLNHFMQNQQKKKKEVKEQNWSRDPWKEKYFGPTAGAIKKIFKITVQDDESNVKAFNVKAETEQQAREIIEKHAPGSTVKTIKFVKNLMAEQRVSEDDPCWKNYKQIGLKKKNGKKVPNCVPKESSNYGDLDEAFNLEEEIKKLDEKSAAWQRKEGKSKTGGLNKKGVASYRRENPGSKLQTAVTTKPSKLKKGSKAAKRRKSFCARMSGVKGPMKDEKGKPTRKALALRKWNC